MTATSIQPRFAAFMASHGRDDYAAFNNTLNRCDFMAWISRCKSTASAPAVVGSQVADQDAFTAHCWQVARDDVMGRAA